MQLINTQLGDRSAKAISDLLKVNSKLRILDVRGNHLVCDSMPIIAEGLEVTVGCFTACAYLDNGLTDQHIFARATLEWEPDSKQRCTSPGCVVKQKSGKD